MSTQPGLDKRELNKYSAVSTLAIIVVLLCRYRTGAYTDGILQLQVFEIKSGLYPPLFGAIAHLIDLVGLDFLSLEDAGRLISFAATFTTFALVYGFCVRFAGQRFALLAGILFLLSPLVWRWHTQVMTDPLYMALSTGAMYCLVQAWVHVRTLSKARAAKLLALATCWGALATLTRYQGILLAPLLGLVVMLYVRRFRSVPWSSIAVSVLWLLVPIWMWYNGFVHQEQFTERTSPTLTATFLAWWNTVESFVLISPYYYGYPVFAAAVAGALYLKRSAQPWYARPTAILWGAYAIMLLVLQARFGSFQYRYMMPLLPIVAVLAGVGFKWLYDSSTSRPWLSRWTLILSLVYLGFFALCVRYLQGEPFLDQYQAAAYIKDQVPVTTPVYSNERYGNFTNLGSVKLSFWTGRTVKPLLPPDQPIQPGSVLVLSNAYGGNEAVGAILDALSQQYELQPLISEPYRSRIVPLMDDIMVNPMFNQNPMGWVMRYVPQQFATNIYRVMPLGSSAQGTANGR